MSKPDEQRDKSVDDSKYEAPSVMDIDEIAAQAAGASRDAAAHCVAAGGYCSIG